MLAKLYRSQMLSKVFKKHLRFVSLIAQEEANSEKVNSYAMAKQVEIEVKQRNAKEGWSVANKRSVISIAVSRKMKVAVDLLSNFGRVCC